MSLKSAITVRELFVEFQSGSTDAHEKYNEAGVLILRRFLEETRITSRWACLDQGLFCKRSGMMQTDRMHWSSFNDCVLPMIEFKLDHQSKAKEKTQHPLVLAVRVRHRNGNITGDQALYVTENVSLADVVNSPSGCVNVRLPLALQEGEQKVPILTGTPLFISCTLVAHAVAQEPVPPPRTFSEFCVLLDNVAVSVQDSDFVSGAKYGATAFIEDAPQKAVGSDLVEPCRTPTGELRSTFDSFEVCVFCRNSRHASEAAAKGQRHMLEGRFKLDANRLCKASKKCQLRFLLIAEMPDGAIKRKYSTLVFNLAELLLNMEFFQDKKFYTGFEGSEVLHFRLRRRTFADCDACTPTIAAADAKVQVLKLDVAPDVTPDPQQTARQLHAVEAAGPNDVQVFDCEDD